ncbi:CoA pyrophosphatase [Methylocella silvestris]|uniref:CoA pyrophosphatase n=1 Tax=Methylocella silvestris TaxID=199596 RepID=A0A2J7TFK8_METSI|nr:CoA pyrophosphatase [Methylocella silvestris]PNG25550.1 CoA pyrophosphatase [Methylocella silvestris]
MTSPRNDRFAPERVTADIRKKLSFSLEPQGNELLVNDPVIDDDFFNGQPTRYALAAGARAAAVLVGLVLYEEEIRVLLTQRAATLRVHAGQIAFPGGKIEPQDDGPIGAALREAHEEIGLASDCVEPLGFLDPYVTGTGFRVIPVVAGIAPRFNLVLNPGEVADVFEAPFSFLMDEANHCLDAREFEGRLRRFYAMTYGERYIWGITAGILRNLYERLYS